MLRERAFARAFKGQLIRDRQIKTPRLRISPECHAELDRYFPITKLTFGGSIARDDFQANFDILSIYCQTKPSPYNSLLRTAHSSLRSYRRLGQLN